MDTNDMRHLLLAGAFALVAAPWSAGCAGDLPRPPGDGNETSACRTIGPAARSELSRVVADGAAATPVVRALEAVLAAQTPPVPAGQTYVMSSLDCDDLETPFSGLQGFTCRLQVQIDGAPAIQVKEGPDSPLAEALLNALQAAGSSSCFDPHGTHIELENVTLSASGAQYGDASNYVPVPPPDIVVQGPDAQAIIDAIAGAQLDDCDPARKLYLICSMFEPAPSCSYQWLPLTRVGESELVAKCGPGTGFGTIGGGLAAADALAVWQAIVTAAKHTGFQPLSGTIEQATVVNSQYFHWDGSTLGFNLVVDHVVGAEPHPRGSLR